MRAERAYLDGVGALVTRYVNEVGPAKTELFGAKAGEHHEKLASLAQQAYPDYALPYLVESGVYGLPGRIASR